MERSAQAVCIGINKYSGEDNLKGCIADAKSWGKFLSSRGFSVSYLLDEEATKAGIINAVRRAYGRVPVNGVIVVQYSGHGTYVVDTSGDEYDQRDEALVPYGASDRSQLLIDDEINKLFSERPTQTMIVFISDSCHSGTVMRYYADGDFVRPDYRRTRFLPPSMFITMEDASKLENRADGFGLPPPSKKSRTSPSPGVIMLSGCRDFEYSSDAYFGVEGYRGAFSYYFQRVLSRSGPEESYQTVFSRLRHFLPNREFNQTPMMIAEDRDANGAAFSLRYKD